MFVIRGVLSNAEYPEYGSIPVDFPIPDELYDHMIERLGRLGIGSTQEQDCKINELNSWYSVLKPLAFQAANVDELNYLAKRLDSFNDYEAAQFQSMASKLELSNMRDFINLTFSCQQATVITNFADLEQIGRDHILTSHGGSISNEEYSQLDKKAEALKLILNENGSVTPYGVVYDNGMKLEPHYDGQHFPPYLYQPCQLAIEIQALDGSSTDCLYFPTPDQQLSRTLECAGATDGTNNRMQITMDELPNEVLARLDLQQESLAEINEMCRAIAGLSLPECKKLDAAILMAQPSCSGEIRRLAENLERFEFVPDVQTPEEYGRYMIQQSGRFEYDSNLEDFYDYDAYGEQKVIVENGQFNAYGYICYEGILSLEELMLADPAEQYQKEIGGITL